MKRAIYLSALLLMLLPGTASAYDFMVDGIYYNIISSHEMTCEVTYEIPYTHPSYSGYSGDIDIPASVSYDGEVWSVTGIGESAFRESSELTSVTIPKSVTSVGNNAFTNCSGLTDLIIEDGNETLTFGKVVFLGCTIESIYLGRNFKCISTTNLPFRGQRELKTLDISDSVTFIDSLAFSYCSGLTAVTIPGSVTSIGGYAFSGCSGLTAVTIANTVASIGDYAFSDCSGLSDLRIESGHEVLSYGKDIFSGCPLDSVFFGRDLKDPSAVGVNPFYAKTGIKSLVIGDSVTILNNEEFYGCTGLTSVTIPSSVTKINAGAFYGCSGLTNLCIEDAYESLFLGASSFSGCSLATVYMGRNSSGIGIIESNPFYDQKGGNWSLVIGNSVTFISDAVFYGCSELSRLYIEDGDEQLRLDHDAFFGCSLDSVYIGRNIYNYGLSAFIGQTGMKSLTIGNSVTYLNDNLFSDCSGLKDVVLGDGLTRIGKYAFSGCTSMTRLVSNASLPPRCDTLALEDINKQTCVLIVPIGSLNLYKTADQWKEFFYIQYPSAIDSPVSDVSEDNLSRVLSGPMDVYNVSGQLLRRSVRAGSVREALSGLGNGVFILRGSGAVCKVASE